MLHHLCIMLFAHICIGWPPVSLHQTIHFLSLSYDLFIDGCEVPAVSGSYFEACRLLFYDHL
jgi:hypothetical protein